MSEYCGCHYFHRSQGLHRFLLGFEDLSPAHAVAFVTAVIGNDDYMGLADSLPGGDGIRYDEGTGDPLRDPTDLRTFIAQHNWRDPVAMQQMGSYVCEVMTQTWHSCRGKPAEVPVSA